MFEQNFLYIFLTSNIVKKTRLVIAILVCGLIVIGCESNPYASLPDVIPTSERDSAPKNPKDVSQVGDAQPKYERRTIAGNKSPYKVMGKVYYVQENPKGYKEKGIASWYGKKFHGRRTANGEVYNMYAMTAAHPTLPIPSYVRVTNLNNFKSIIVRVNDRGPFHPGRVIDLSYAGAYKLDYLAQGTAPVSVEYIDTDHLSEATGVLESVSKPYWAPQRSGKKTTSANLYYQFGAFSLRSSAEKLSRKISQKTSLPVNVITDHAVGSASAKSALYKVHLGPVLTNADRRKVDQLVKSLDMERPLSVFK